MQLLNSLKPPPPPPPNARNTFIPYAIFQSVMVLNSGVAPPQLKKVVYTHVVCVYACMLGL